jgi:O-antigen ligase
MTMATSANDRRSVVLALAPMALPLAALAFLFSGFYKGLVTSPVDLTALTGALTCIALLPFLRDLDAHRQAATWLLAALTAYLALRLLPSPAPWGLRKLAELVLFGAPAFLAGYVIAKRADALSFLWALCSYAAVPMAAAMALKAAFTDAYAYQWIGSGGYQLTGLFMGLAMLSAAISRRYVCFVFAVLGLAVTGNLTTALFAPIGLALIWWKVRAPVVKPLAAVTALLVLYIAAVGPPMVFMRVLWKVGAIERNLVQDENAPRYGGAPLTEKILKLMPEDSHHFQVDKMSSDRVYIFAAAWRKFVEAPFVGHGYGSLEYEGHQYPHNALLELLAEGGIVAAALLIAVILAARPPLDDDAGVFVAAALILLLGSALVSGYWGNRILLFLIGMAAARRSCAR